MNKNRIRHLLFQHGIGLSVFNIASPTARLKIRGLCLQEVIRQSPALRRMYSRILCRANIQKARVAVARKLAVIIYAMFRRNEPFRAEAT
jgi:hypothetical protein